jgi:hypothetical protein
MGGHQSSAERRRPDGREADVAIVRLRAATRALRLHLDGLPAVFHFDGAGDQFLAESAFPFARWRYACADSLLGSEMGGTVVGALARSLFDDGLRWQWIAQDPAQRRAVLVGSTLEERNRVCTCPNLPNSLAALTDRPLEQPTLSRSQHQAPPVSRGHHASPGPEQRVIGCRAHCGQRHYSFWPPTAGAAPS